jgi:Ala-tRNA(Pro) deacylase
MKVIKFLDKSGVKYEVMEHRPIFTAQRMAAEDHESGKYVAKPVIVKVDGKYVMCVIAACCKVDMDALKNNLGAKTVELAEEKEIAKIFSDCEVGAEPPFGNLYDLIVILDKSLDKCDHIRFQGGTHKSSVRMSMDDYRKLANPRVLDISCH